MKMINLLIVISLVLLCSYNDDTPVKLIPTNYGTNEQFELRVHYGFITAGEAKVEVLNDYYLINNRVCFKVQCTGRSIGAFDLAMRIRDTWSSYIDTSTKIAHRSFRHIEEGKYYLKEMVQYKYDTKKAILDNEKRKSKSHEEYDLPGEVHDIVSGAYYLRVIDYESMNPGDMFTITAFFENKIYNMKMRYKGKEVIKTSFGKIEAYKLAPIMPENSLFEGENSIRCWLSADKNRLPLKIEADMFVGAVEVDLKSYKNLKYPINFK
ncbi:MAG: DUF3108 domain-containing protein [Cytophagaceae bacterium]|nr:DUF3108 domain-containing protein [Cytophagaceae bacterium]MDW8456528.1 DUF3108 domain-containing protein [Cytophagaceae bacterium]